MGLNVGVSGLGSSNSGRRRAYYPSGPWIDDSKPPVPKSAMSPQPNPYKSMSPVRERIGATGKKKFRLGDPNPMKFKLVREEHVGEYLIAEINYPDCKNYEGNKIVVYHNLMTLKNYKELDPHFLEKGVSPVARFEPTEKGWKNAVTFAKAASK